MQLWNQVTVEFENVLHSLQRPRNLSILPWQESMTLDPIRQVLSAPAPNEDERTRAWRDAKLAELSYVGLTSGLITAAVASAFTWSGSGVLTAPVRGLWYSALIVVLAAVSIATQQSIMLHRLGSNSEGMQRLRRSLLRNVNAQKWEPSKMQVLIWQMAVMLLNISISLFGIGLLLQICMEFGKTGEGVETMLMSALALIFGAACYVTSYVGVYANLS
ncbi:hypothetical protein LTR37_011442 [Vermiconidia calcicola]|uniref:Uncharacterized protein n=1 Tax=Vermiconidia calcicola TaxID=1690605 RepID=A0ACC3N245_9PEZI|nr:hypothetical protein LTR37_011442 [Vermiconidia calcicola]